MTPTHSLVKKQIEGICIVFGRKKRELKKKKESVIIIMSHEEILFSSIRKYK